MEVISPIIYNFKSLRNPTHKTLLSISANQPNIAKFQVGRISQCYGTVSCFAARVDPTAIKPNYWVKNRTLCHQIIGR